MTLEEDVVQWARIDAARRDTGVSRLLGELLKERMTAQDGYERAMRRALGRKPFLRSTGRYLTREEAHARSRFVNSNVFLYAVDEVDPRKQRVARDWLAALWKSRQGRVSFQVLNEFYVNAMRLKSGVSDEARAEVRDLLAWNPVVVDAALIERGWKLQDRYQLSFWDS